MISWPIYVLTLPDAERRRALLIRSLFSMKLEHEIVFGIDGRQGLPNQWESEVDRSAASKTMGRYLSEGELACALSHREIYRKILLREQPGAIIFEDDAIIDTQFSTFVEEEHYLKAPLIMLDHSHARVSRPSATLMPGVVMRQLALPSCLTTAYSISATAAAALLKAASPVRAPADWPGDIVALGAVALEPRIVKHPDPTSGDSNLEADRKAIPQQQGKILRATNRWTDREHWRRWLIKRRSNRIS